MKEADIQPVIGQKIAPADGTAFEANPSNDQMSKDDSPYTSDSTHLHSKSMDKSTSTAPSDITAKGGASIVVSSEPAYKAMIHCHDKLVTALSTDIITISGVLLAKEFIPSEISNKMLLPNFTESWQLFW